MNKYQHASFGNEILLLMFKSLKIIRSFKNAMSPFDVPYFSFCHQFYPVTLEKVLEKVWEPKE